MPRKLLGDQGWSAREGSEVRVGNVGSEVRVGNVGVERASSLYHMLNSRLLHVLGHSSHPTVQWALDQKAKIMKGALLCSLVSSAPHPPKSSQLAGTHCEDIQFRPPLPSSARNMGPAPLTQTQTCWLRGSSLAPVCVCALLSL